MVFMVATPDTFHVRAMLETARAPVRTHSESDAVLQRQEKVGKVFLSEHELVIGMTHHILENLENLEKQQRNTPAHSGFIAH